MIDLKTLRTGAILVAIFIAPAAAQSTQTDSTRSDSTKQSGVVKPAPLSTPFRICAGGDVTLGTNLDTMWARNASTTLRRRFGLWSDPDSLVNSLRPIVQEADVLLLNVEGAIGTGPAPRKCPPGSKNCYAFRQPTNAAAALRSLVDSNGVVVGNVANNHSGDAGNDGRERTIEYLRKAGVFVTGRDTLATAVPLPSGDTIGVLGFYTSSETPDARDLAAVRRHVARAAEQFAVVIVTMHLGAEGASAQRTRDANEIFLNGNRGNPVAFANAAFGAGATMVIGHGPHVLRAAEWRDDQLVFYSLGNLLTYGPFNISEPTNRGVIACASIDSARHVAAAELRPTVQLAPGVLQADSSRRALWLIDSLSTLDFPVSGAKIDSTGVVLKRGNSPITP